MEHRFVSSRVRAAGVAMGLACVLPAAWAQTPAPSAAGAAMSSHCTSAEHRLLDYWIGDWDTFESDAPNGASIARARVTPVAQGCGIHELYEQEDGLIGDSLLSYDPVRKQWQQTWVTNRGGLMVLWGGLQGDVLVLEGDVHMRDGRSVLQRIHWQRQGDGVREWALLSKDGGKTWEPAFDVLFKPRAAAAR